MNSRSLSLFHIGGRVFDFTVFIFFSDIDECEEGLSDRCDPNSECSNRVGGYECTCRPGYSGDGSLCSGKNVWAFLLLKSSVFIVYEVSIILVFESCCGR